MDSNFEICELVAKERQIGFSKGRQAIAGLYYEDATVITSWLGQRVPVQDYIARGKDPLKADPEHPSASRIGFPVVHRNGNRAYVEVPQITIRWVSVNGEKAVLICFMRLIYRVEKREEEWKISDFRSIYESDMLVPEIPGADLRLDRERLASLRHSYRYLAYVDDNVSPDLPGVDRPDEVKKLYNELDQWLNG